MKYLMLVFPLLLMACDDKGIPKPSNPLQQLSAQENAYQLPSIDNKIIFPQAHQPHKNFRHEWWYLTANLTDEKGQHFAAQWTLFRTAVNKQNWYFAHGALADSTHHFSAFRNAREAFGNISIKKQPFSATIDDWSWQSTADLLPASLMFSDNNHKVPWKVSLNLTDDNHYYLQGEQGYNRKHATLDIASHYYSQPFIKVSGEVFLKGKKYQVTGDAWFDREWGSQMLAPDQEGWDWFSLRLSPELALMVYRIRSNKQDHLYASLMDKNGGVTTLSADDITILANTDVDEVYPQQFRISLSKHNIDLTINVINNKQIMRFGIEYFEGMVNFSGSHQGVGFLEMTGY